MKRKIIIALSLMPLLSLAACEDHNTHQDAANGTRVDRSVKDVIAMPNDFGNVAHACDGHGHRVFVTTNTAHPSQLFVINDATCGGG